MYICISLLDWRILVKVKILVRLSRDLIIPSKNVYGGTEI